MSAGAGRERSGRASRRAASSSSLRALRSSAKLRAALGTRTTVVGGAAGGTSTSGEDVCDETAERTMDVGWVGGGSSAV